MSAHISPEVDFTIYPPWISLAIMCKFQINSFTHQQRTKGTASHNTLLPTTIKSVVAVNQVKLPAAMPTSQIGASSSPFQLSLFWSSSLHCTWGNKGNGLYTQWATRRKLLTLAWPGPGCCGLQEANEWMDQRSSSFCLFITLPFK